jgi:hypothetical protein
VASIKRRADGVYRARYRDPAGRERVRHFARKTHAQRWLDEAITAVVTGTWVDPTGGRVSSATTRGRGSRRRSTDGIRPSLLTRRCGCIRPHVRRPADREHPPVRDPGVREGALRQAGAVVGGDGLPAHEIGLPCR